MIHARIAEVTREFLDQIHSFRYQKAIPPEDEGKQQVSNSDIPSRDLFSYGQLVRETIGKCVDSGVTNALVFQELATKQMLNSNCKLRGTSTSLLQHSFFNQPLLHAQHFLSQITFKSISEKEEFFKY